jgi:transcriptional regulator with XRE-family HTH domain
MTIVARTSYTTQPTLAYHSYDGQIRYTFTTPDFRRLCGQWLTWYRLQHGLTVTALSRQIGIATNLLNLMELGRATPQTISIAMCTRIGEVLSRDCHSAVSIAHIIAGAAGHLHKLDEYILGQIRADITSGLPL